MGGGGIIKLRGLLLGVVFAVTAVGFAGALPGPVALSDVDPIEPNESMGSVESVETEAGGDADVRSPKREKPKHAEDEPDVEGDEDQTNAEDQTKPDDGHGSVVSVVAKCDVKGRWHGEAVRSIAQNKEATAADAEAACAAAQAAAAAAGGPGKSADARSKSKPKGKPSWAGAKAKGPKVKAEKPGRTDEESHGPPEHSRSSSQGSARSSGRGGPPPGKGKGKP